MKSLIFLSAHRPVIFVSVYHALFELADEAIVKRFAGRESLAN